MASAENAANFGSPPFPARGAASFRVSGSGVRADEPQSLEKRETLRYPLTGFRACAITCIPLRTESGSSASSAAALQAKPHGEEKRSPWLPLTTTNH
jgi:hypothetical protein